MIGVNDPGMLEGLRRHGMNHKEEAAAAAYRLSLPRAPFDWSRSPRGEQQERPAYG